MLRKKEVTVTLIPGASFDADGMSREVLNITEHCRKTSFHLKRGKRELNVRQ